MAKATLNAKRILLVHAHPDDESLFTGHLIAERLAAGAEVMLLTLTRGERGRVKLEEIKSILAADGEPTPKKKHRDSNTAKQSHN